MGTLLLHVSLLHSVLLGTRAQKLRPPDVHAPGATLIKSATGPAEALILVELPSADMNAQSLRDEIASAGSAPTPLVPSLISPDPLPQVNIPLDNVDDNAETPAPVESGDPESRVLLFGRYSGQIQARIERAWRRPRSPVSESVDRSRNTAVGSPDVSSAADDPFRCQVRIVQDAHGSVQEVQMLNCNGTVSWQQSLVAAILSASPLPAPPDPKVFTPSLTMTFMGKTYLADSPSDDYASE